MTNKWDATSEHLLRGLAPQVLGAVARRFRDFSSAEDAVQEAMIAASPSGRSRVFPRIPAAG
jgi:predicted RNA polymerase sigma factor